MKLELKTKQLQKMVAAAIKGASNNKLLAITSMMEIALENNVLTLTTTDMTNFLQISQDKVDGEDFSIVVPVELFSKLVAKISADKTTLTLGDDYLEVKGNGKYQIDLPMDEGELIVFPKYEIKLAKKPVKVKLSILKQTIAASKASLGVLMDDENKHLTGILFAEKALASDGNKAAATDTEVFAKQNILMAPEALDLINVFIDTDQEDLEVHPDGDALLIVGTVGGKDVVDEYTTKIYTVQIPDKEDYPVEAIEEFVNIPFEHKVNIPLGETLKALDRVALFVSEYDDNAVDLTFEADKFMIMSKKTNGSEVIKYSKKAEKAVKPFTASIDVNMFKAQLEAIDKATVDLSFGHEKAIKMESGNLTILVALKEE